MPHLPHVDHLVGETHPHEHISNTGLVVALKLDAALLRGSAARELRLQVLRQFLDVELFLVYTFNDGHYLAVFSFYRIYANSLLFAGDFLTDAEFLGQATDLAYLWQLSCTSLFFHYRDDSSNRASEFTNPRRVLERAPGGYRGTCSSEFGPQLTEFRPHLLDVHISNLTGSEYRHSPHFPRVWLLPLVPLRRA